MMSSIVVNEFKVKYLDKGEIGVHIYVELSSKLWINAARLQKPMPSLFNAVIDAVASDLGTTLEASGE